MIEWVGIYTVDVSQNETFGKMSLVRGHLVRIMGFWAKMGLFKRM